MKHCAAFLAILAISCGKSDPAPAAPAAAKPEAQEVPAAKSPEALYEASVRHIRDRNYQALYQEIDPKDRTWALDRVRETFGYLSQGLEKKKKEEVEGLLRTIQDDAARFDYCLHFVEERYASYARQEWIPENAFPPLRPLFDRKLTLRGIATEDAWATASVMYGADELAAHVWALRKDGIWYWDVHPEMESSAAPPYGFSAKPALTIERLGRVRMIRFTADGSALVWDGGRKGIEWRKLAEPTVRESGIPSGARFAMAAKKNVVATDGDRSLRVWELETGKVLQTIPTTEVVRGLALSSDGAMLAQVGNASITLWDVSKGSEVRRLKVPKTVERTVPEGGLAFSPDGTRIAARGTGSSLLLWRVADGGFLGVSTGGMSSEGEPTFSPDGKLVALEMSLKQVGWLEVDRPSRLTMLQAGGTVSTVACAPDGSHFVTVGYEDGLSIWNMKLARRVAVIPLGRPTWTLVAYAPDGRRVAVVADTGAGSRILVFERS